MNELRYLEQRRVVRARCERRRAGVSTALDAGGLVTDACGPGTTQVPRLNGDRVARLTNWKRIPTGARRPSYLRSVVRILESNGEEAATGRVQRVAGVVLQDHATVHRGPGADSRRR